MISNHDLRDFEVAAPYIKTNLEQLNLVATEEVVRKLYDFVNLLFKWNKAYNLTAVRDFNQMFPSHIWDSLVVSPFLEGRSCLDIGTGAGPPGIPLAILNPDIRFVLLDSNGKKTRFVQQAKTELGMENVEVVHSRIENYQPGFEFDCLISRAVDTISGLIKPASHLFHPKNVFLFLKSREVSEELELLSDEYGKKLVQLNVPDLEAERFLIQVRYN